MVTLIISFIILAEFVAGELVIVFTPLLVYFATLFITWLAPKIQGLAILLVLVPILAAAAAWVSGLVFTEGLGFWAEFGLGLAAVFVNETVERIIELTKT